MSEAMKIDPLAIYTYDDLTSSFSVTTRLTTTCRLRLTTFQKEGQI